MGCRIVDIADILIIIFYAFETKPQIKNKNKNNEN